MLIFIKHLGVFFMKIKLFLLVLMLGISFAEEPYEKILKESLLDDATKEKIAGREGKLGEIIAERSEDTEKKIRGYANVQNGDCIITVTNPNSTNASVATEVVQYDINAKRIKGMPYGFNLKGGETVTRTVNGTAKTTRCDLTIKKSKVAKKVLTDEEKLADLEAKKTKKLELEKQIQELETPGATLE